MLNLDFSSYIFDFDGVLFDTNNIKEKAIRKAVEKNSDDQNLVATFLEYFTSNNGLSREYKINKFFNSLESKLILTDYNSILDSSLLDALPCDCSLELVKKLHNLNKNIFILSGGEESEIMKILTKFNILECFVSIYTSNTPKSSALEIIKENKEECIFFGDSAIDYQAAQSANVKFLFVRKYSQDNYMKNFFLGDGSINSLCELKIL